MRKMEKQYNYYCPTCSASLNVKNNVVLTVRKRNGDSGIVFLDTELGDYTKVKSSSLKLEKGEIVQLFCPVCHKNLLCLPDYNLARLVMKDKNGENLTVLFSVKYGEESTYIMKDKKIHEKFGKHKQEIDFESMSLCK